MNMLTSLGMAALQTLQWDGCAFTREPPNCFGYDTGEFLLHVSNVQFGAFFAVPHFVGSAMEIAWLNSPSGCAIPPICLLMRGAHPRKLTIDTIRAYAWDVGAQPWGASPPLYYFPVGGIITRSQFFSREFARGTFAKRGAKGKKKKYIANQFLLNKYTRMSAHVLHSAATAQIGGSTAL